MASSRHSKTHHPKVGSHNKDTNHRAIAKSAAGINKILRLYAAGGAANFRAYHQDFSSWRPALVPEGWQLRQSGKMLPPSMLLSRLSLAMPHRVLQHHPTATGGAEYRRDSPHVGGPFFKRLLFSAISVSEALGNHISGSWGRPNRTATGSDEGRTNSACTRLAQMVRAIS